ncbi:MAG: hypothetical protein HY718_12010, partial [Planctomycetes bacterium]|nr:hypothetical protein [Planctomycetota bacterium]
LLVLPECAYPAYLLGSIESYRSGEHLSSDQFVTWLGRQAADYGVHVVCGYVEDTGDGLFNSAILLGPDGRVIGRTRKRFLWHVDHDWFTAGDQIAVFETAIGRIGAIICAEARVPEIIATLAAGGAELIVMPTCWINTSRQPGEYYNPQSDYLIEARAREFGLPFVCADKCGLEITTGYVGQSCIAGADGITIVRAPAAGEALVVSTLEPRPAPPLWMNGARRTRLLDHRSTTLPDRTSPRHVTIAAVSTAFANSQFTGGMGESLFNPLRQQGVDTLIANMPLEATAERLTMLARAFDIHAAAFPLRTDLMDLGPARVGCMAGQWLRSFAPARVLALDGAEVLVYFDAADLTLLRTRALENRVFVVGVDGEASAIIGPDGGILADGTAQTAAIARVDLAEASDKHVAPRTDIFAERRVGLYRF